MWLLKSCSCLLVAFIVISASEIAEEVSLNADGIHRVGESVANVDQELPIDKLDDLNEDIDEATGEDGFVVRGSTNNNQRRCPTGEEYLTCGPTCQITCGTLGTSCPTGDCQAGCFCKGSRVRSTSGQCISQRSCPSELTSSFFRGYSWNNQLWSNLWLGLSTYTADNT